MDYQLTPIESGKWYVSDGGPVKRLGGSPNRMSTREQYPGIEDARLRGPCDTEAEAKAIKEQLIEADSSLRGNRLKVWQAP